MEIKPKEGVQKTSPPVTDASAVSPSIPVEEVQKVEVPAEMLKGVLERLELVEAANKEKDEQISILRDSVSRGKLEEAEGSRKPKGLPTAKLMIFDGKVVVGFRMTKNDYLYNPVNPNVPYGEELQMELVFLDGSKQENVDYVKFIRTTDRADVVKVGEEDAFDKKGNLFRKWVVEFVDKSLSSGRIAIDPQFINP